MAYEQPCTAVQVCNLNFGTSQLRIQLYGSLRARPVPSCSSAAFSRQAPTARGPSNRGKLEMQTEGIRKAALSLIIVLATSLSFCRPLEAQYVITNLPRLTESGENPVSFMRPHYSVFTPDPSTEAATTPGAPPTTAFNPTQIRHAYGFDLVSNQGAGQTIGIVDAYDDPNAEADLGVFDQQYGLAACSSSNGCFRKVYSTGKAPVS